MFHMIIFGPPGSGKGTQSKLIAEEYNMMHLSTGDILRHEIKMGTELGNSAKKFIDKGLLVPDDLILNMIENKIKTLDSHTSVIFDGFPRTVEQAKELKKILHERGDWITVLLNLEVPREVLIERLLKRAEISGRTDDTLETIEERLKVYEKQTAPVIEYITERTCYRSVSKIGTIEEIFNKVKEEIEGLVRKSL